MALGSLCTVCFCVFLTAVTFLQEAAPVRTIDPTNIKKVHLVFMNHLDVGYDGIYPQTGFALNVINKYFTQYYPRAAAIAEKLRLLGFRERLVYTTHPWLLQLYLNCPSLTLASNVTLKCPSKAEVEIARQAIASGDLVWHAGPMNMQYEYFMDPVMLDLSLNISFLLDRQFEIHRTTPVLSLRDVPGLTKAVIPVVKKYNISAITVGVNLMTSPPAVPATPFVWKLNPQDKDEDGIIAFWHPGGYPNNPGDFPITAGGMSVKDCLFAEDVDAFPETLCFAFRTDNSGPPASVEEVLSNFEVARGQFPNAVVQGSSLDEYVAALKASGTTYPTVAQEIGDTWIMGVQSDPKKTAMYRAFVRVFADCLTKGFCHLDDPRISQAAFYVTKIPEHTWGLDSLPDCYNWSNSAFQKARSGKNYTDRVAAWQEQRQFMDLTLSSLGSHPVATAVKNEFMNMEAVVPNLSDYEITSTADQFKCADGTLLAFARDGSLNRLFDPYNKVEWATDKSRIGQVLYNTYNESDYDYMSKLYDYMGGAGFHKTNSTPNAHPASRQWDVKAESLYKRKGNSSCDFIVKITPTDQDAVSDYGAPPVFYVHYTYAPVTDDIIEKGGLEVVLQWFNKEPTRLSEAISFGFSPNTRMSAQWTMSKLGEVIDPMNVILNGSHYLHAVNKGVYYLDKNQTGLQILSPDVALLTYGTASRPPSVLPVPLVTPTEPFVSATFNIYNNLWNTNYIYWYPFVKGDENFKARFYLNFV